MEVRLTPETEAELTRMAAERGSDTALLVQEAVERFLVYDEWFVHEVDRGVAAADRGELLSHEEAGKRVAKVLAAKQLRV